MTRKVLTPAAAMEIKRLYALEDERGNKIHSQMEIADMLGVSETTVFRTIHKKGAYKAVRELPSDEEARASMQRFMESEGLAKLAEVAAPVNHANELLEEIDASPKGEL